MPAEPGTLAVSLGRAFADATFEVEPVRVETRFGPATVHRFRDQWLLFRHGRAYDRLPHQVPFRAQMAALKELGVQSLLSTGYAGVLVDEIPLHQPILVDDVVMPTGLLPDGTAASMFDQGGGYLVVEDTLVSEALSKQIRTIATLIGQPLPLDEVELDHIAGPRGRTRAETRRLAAAGAQAVSMTLVPEIALANEVGISVAAVVMGYRTLSERLTHDEVERRLAQARDRLESLGAAFLTHGRPVEPVNRLQRYGRDT